MDSMSSSCITVHQKPHLEESGTERPLKRQKLLASSHHDAGFETEDDCFSSVLDIINAGINFHSSGKYRKAEDHFLKALQHFNALSTDDAVPIRAELKSDTSDHHVPNQEKCDQATLVVGYEQTQVPPSRNMNIDADYHDEGMRVYKELLRLRQLPADDIQEGTISAMLCFNIAQTYVERTLYREAILWFRRSFDNLSGLPQWNEQESLWAVKTVHCLGYCQYRLRNDMEAKILYVWALSLASSASKLNFSTKLLYIAASLNCSGVMMFNDEDHMLSKAQTDQVLAIFHRSLDVFRSCSTMDQARPTEEIVTEEDQVSILTILNNIGRVHIFRSEFHEAALVYEECLQLLRRQQQQHRKVVHFSVGAALYYNVGLTYYELNRFEESLSCYYKFLEMKKRSQCPASMKRDVAFVHKGIGDIYYAKREFRMAMVHFHQAIKLYCVDCYDEDVPGIDVASLLNQMGSSSYMMQNLKEAIVYYGQALKIEMDVLEPYHSHTIITLTNIAHIHRQLGEYRKALPVYELLYEMQKLKREEDPTTSNNLAVSDTMAWIGFVQYHLLDYASSLDFYQEALRLRREFMDGEDHLENASILLSLGIVFFQQDMFEVAKQCFEESIRIKSRILGCNTREVATIWYNIATTYLRLGGNDIALEIFKRTLHIERKVLGTNHHPDFILILQYVAQVHQQLGYFEDSIQYFVQALDSEKMIHGRTCSLSQRRSLLNLLGNVYLRLGKTDEMMKCFIEASRIHHGNPLESAEEVGYTFYDLSQTNPTCAPKA